MILPENIPHYVNPVFYKENQQRPIKNQGQNSSVDNTKYNGYTNNNKVNGSTLPFKDSLEYEELIKLTKQVKAGKGSRLSNIDGYKWRKYGEKVVRDCDYPRHYYKCSYHGCDVRKVCVFDSTGQCVHLELKGEHNHSPRRDLLSNINSNTNKNNLNIKPKAQSIDNKKNQSKVFNVYKSKKKIKPQGSIYTNDKFDVKPLINQSQKKRKISNHLQQSNEVHVPQVLQSEDIPQSQEIVKQFSQNDKRILIVNAPMEQSGYEDGYRYKKYGCKSVKDNSYPRNYYRCVECPMRRLVERWPENPRYLMVTYEEEHTHEPSAQPLEIPNKKQKYSQSQVQEE